MLRNLRFYNTRDVQNKNHERQCRVDRTIFIIAFHTCLECTWASLFRFFWYFFWMFVFRFPLQYISSIKLLLKRLVGVDTNTHIHCCCVSVCGVQKVMVVMVQRSRKVGNLFFNLTFLNQFIINLKQVNTHFLLLMCWYYLELCTCRNYNSSARHLLM